jgi:hypothetical protein
LSPVDPLSVIGLEAFGDGSEDGVPFVQPAAHAAIVAPTASTNPNRRSTQHPHK